MTLVVHRSARVEWLADALDAVLRSRFARDAAQGNGDPFAPVEIIVGSRGMERWLRQRLATGPGRIAAQLQFPFPRAALEAATGAVLGDVGDPAQMHAARQRWSREAAASHLVRRLRSHAHDPRFAAAAAYLGAGVADWARPDTPVRARELLFAQEVAAVLDRLLHDRAEQALRWMAAPDAAPAQHQWLAALLAAWRDDAAPRPSPAERFAALLTAPARAQGSELHLFGLSTLGRSEVARVGALAQSFDVHLYALAPSSVWWEHVRTRSETRRAALAATTAGAAAEVQAEFVRHNALLAALGRPSRDLQGWLEAVGYVEDEAPGGANAMGAPESKGSTGPTVSTGPTLHRLQHWIEQAGDRDQLGPLRPDSSLELHAAFGPMRQVEALRDRLLALLDADRTLTPRDILVMTPDLATFAPLCAAIFARKGVGHDGKRLPALPAHVADLGLRSTNPLAALLLQLLALCGDRLTIAGICDLAALEPVRRRFGIDGEDLAGLTALAVRSGMRWGLDADDRAAAGQPAAFEHTLRFGLERLALGALWPDDDGPLDVVEAAAAAGPGAAMALRPVPLGSADARRRFGQLAQLIATVDHHRRALQQPRLAAQWRADLLAAVDALGEVSERATWLRVELDETLATLLPDDQDDDDDDDDDDAPEAGLRLEADAVRRLLPGAFDSSTHGDRPITGAITVCALEPMRSVPFRVVALLGLDDGAFPRSSRDPTWSPFATPEPGERDRREVDRHLLLEAMISARDHLLVLWSGFDLQSGDALPAAVPIEELIDLLVDRGAADAGAQQRGAWVRPWPLQPWSPARFAAEAPASFDSDLAAAATQLARHRQEGSLAAPLGSAARDLALHGATQALPARERGDDDLDVTALARDLAAPAATLLTRRLQVQGGRDVTSLEEREPFDLGTLDQWSLSRRAIDALLTAEAGDVADAARWCARLEQAERGAGTLPHGVVGSAAIATAFDNASRVVGRLGPTELEAASRPQAPVRCQIDGVTLHAMAHIQLGDRLLWLTPSQKANARLRLEACYGTLVARVAATEAGGDDERPVEGLCIGSAAKDAKAITRLRAPDAATARRWLRQALALRERALREALPLFEGVGWALATAHHVSCGGPLTAKQRSDLRAAVKTAWSGSFGGAPGDGDDAAVRQLWQGWSPLDALDQGDPLGMMAVAFDLWSPVIAMMEAGGSEIDASIRDASEEGDR